MKKKHILAVLLAAMLTASQITACGSKESSSSNTEPTTSSSTEASSEESTEDASQGDKTGSTSKYMGQGEVGNKWLAPVFEAYTDAEKPELKDDFFTAINYDKFKTLQLKDGDMSAGTWEDMNDIMKEKILALLNDDSITGHDIEVCRAVYKAAIDWDARNKAGITPFEESLKKIQGIKTIDDVTAIITGCDSFIPGLFSADVTEGLFEQKGKNILDIGPASMLYQDPADYENPTQQAMMISMMAQQQLDYLFPKFGMTAEESKTALEKCTEFEKAFASVLPSNEEQSAPDFV
ncbi:MAG: M13 family metallopeptidase, partial [Ruminococcus sp.]|nr:M13 family metallopeptidase [Ruminococcus sp.]